MADALLRLGCCSVGYSAALQPPLSRRCWAWLMMDLQATAKSVDDLRPLRDRPGCCRFDKVFGMFKTKAGKWRRLDVIMSPFEQYPFCLLGWTGSRQW